jgi:hypothetical protein
MSAQMLVMSVQHEAAVFQARAPVVIFSSRRSRTHSTSSRVKDRTDQDEQEGMMHLFMGAVMALRNPRAHTLAPDSAEEALEAIAMFSFLAKRLDGARKIKTTP